MTDPLEVIRKTRIDDVNVKKGASDFVFENDFRLSASKEEKLDNKSYKQGLKVNNIRIKKRHKY